MYSLHGPAQPSAHSDCLINAQHQQQTAGSIQPLISQNMQPNGADVCYQQQQGHLQHTAAEGACSYAAPAGYVQQQRHCTASPGPNSMLLQQTASPGAAVTQFFNGSQEQQQQQQQQEPMQCPAAGQLLGAVMSTIEQELQREIRQFAGAVVQRHKQQLLKEIQSLSLAAAAAAGVADAQADVPSRPSSSMAAAAGATGCATGCGSCTCTCHAAAAAPAGYAAAAAACQQQQQQVSAGYPAVPLGSVSSNEPALISFMSAGAAGAAAAATPAAAPLSTAYSGHSHDSVSLAMPCNPQQQQQQQQQRVDSPASAGANSSGTEWNLQSHCAAASPAAAAAAPGSSVQQSFAFAAPGGARSSSSPDLCVSMPTPTAAAGFAAAHMPATFSLFEKQNQKVLQNPLQPQQQQQQQQPCRGQQQSFSSHSMHSSQLLDLPSLPHSAFAKQQQQLLGEADLFASFDAACGDSTEPIADNIFEEIDALLSDDPLNDVLDPVMGLEDQPLLLQASLQQVQHQLQQLEQQQQQQQQPAAYGQLQLDVGSATCSAAAADQLYSPCDQQQQQQLTPCSAQVAAAVPAAVFAQPRPLYRSFSACSSKSNRSRTAAAAAALTRCGSQSSGDLSRKRSRMVVDPAAAAAAPVCDLPALKRQGSNKSSSSGGDAWPGSWQQQQQAVGVDLMSQLPPWLTRQVSITASLASHSH